MQLLEDFGAAEVKITRHLQEYKDEWKATTTGEIEMVELPDNDSIEHIADNPIPTAQEVTQSTTPAPEPTSEETLTTTEVPQEEAPRPAESKAAPMPTTNEDVQPEPRPELMSHKEPATTTMTDT